MLRRVSLILVVALVGCSGRIGAPPRGEQAPPAADIDSVELPVRTFARPQGFGTALHVATLGPDTLLGGSGGLLKVTGEGLERLDDEPVAGIALHASENKLVIARPDRIDVFDGRDVAKVSIYKQLDGSPVTAIGARGTAEIWIGTSRSLWRLADGALSRFQQIEGVKHVVSFAGATRLVLRDARDAVVALKQAPGDTWLMRPLSMKSAPQQIVPRPDGSLLALADGALWVFRDAADGQAAAWQPMTFGESARSLEDVRQLALSPRDGTLWIVAEKHLYRLDGDSLVQVLRPSGLAEVVAARVADDGALWLADASTLYRIGETGPPPTYADDVQPFIAANCTRCHAHQAEGSNPLDTFARVKASVDALISAIETQRMPADRKPLVGGDANLLRRWRIGGTKR